MADGNFVQIAPLMREPGVMEIKTPPKLQPSANGAMICGMDVGSTTVKYVLASPSGEVISQAYERHNTKQGEKVLQFLARLEAQHDFTPQRDRIFFTGSGAGLIAPAVGAKVIQEVVAVAASVESVGTVTHTSHQGDRHVPFHQYQQ
jgi:activator of 2-hydroxyglutaryl-CoA dehydratase